MHRSSAQFRDIRSQEKVKKRGVIKKRGMVSVNAFETEAKTESEKPKKGIAHLRLSSWESFPSLATATLVAFRPTCRRSSKNDGAWSRENPNRVQLSSSNDVF